MNAPRCDCWLNRHTGRSLECPVHAPLLNGPDGYEWKKWALSRGELLHTERRLEGAS